MFPALWTVMVAKSDISDNTAALVVSCHVRGVARSIDRLNKLLNRLGVYLDLQAVLIELIDSVSVLQNFMSYNRNVFCSVLGRYREDI